MTIVTLHAIKVVIHMWVSGQPDLGPKWVRLTHKWNKSGTFSDKISVHFWLGRVLWAQIWFCWWTDKGGENKEIVGNCSSFTSLLHYYTPVFCISLCWSQFNIIGRNYQRYKFLLVSCLMTKRLAISRPNFGNKTCFFHILATLSVFKLLVCL